MIEARVVAQELRLRRSTQMGAVYFHGETMRPFLGEGDLVVVEPLAWEEIRLGDILTYRHEDKFPTRRVVEIDHEVEAVILRGDSIPGRPDFVVSRTDVLGRAQVRIRNGVRLTRDSREWRRATRRALTFERIARVVRRLPWPVRGTVGRMFPVIRFG